MKQYGSLEAMLAKSAEELSKEGGISLAVAKRILSQLSL
jgi:DNA integrity scanning protein DisA with diadenylate cyclase activity